MKREASPQRAIEVWADWAGMNQAARFGVLQATPGRGRDAATSWGVPGAEQEQMESAFRVVNASGSFLFPRAAMIVK